MSAYRCTKHPDGPRSHGECTLCRRDRQRAYRQRCRDAYKQLRQVAKAHPELLAAV